MISLHIDTAPTWRGGQNQALLTVLGLRSLGHRAVLVAHPEGELRRRAAEGPDLIPLAPRAEMDLSAAWKLTQVVRQTRPAVIHAHDPHGVAMASLALSLRPPAPAPVLVASRRVDFHLRRNAFSRWKHRLVDCFICASEAIRRMVIADGIAPDRAVTIHEGIDLQHVRAAPAANVHQELWLPSHAPLVGNVAALVPHKGQKHLVEAAALVHPRAPDARFLIVGEGELRPSLERQIHDLHLEKHVILAGFRPDVLSLMKGFDLFVMSSVTEGLGTSILDAMACGRPVVATRAGGIPEVVEEGVTGLLVEPRDAAALADAILELLQHPERRRQMGAAGAQLVERRFSAERMVRETAALYRRLAGRPRGAGTDRRPTAG